MSGVEETVIHRVLAEFRGLEHRLEHVAEVAGRRFYNDSKATSPRATMAALEAIVDPLWLLAGGHAKGASFDELAEAIVRRARGAALFGRARQQLCGAIRARQA